jgi:hypothetical protein
MRSNRIARAAPIYRNGGLLPTPISIGLVISAHLKSYDVDHAVWKICVNHFAAIAE